MEIGRGDTTAAVTPICCIRRFCFHSRNISASCRLFPGLTKPGEHPCISRIPKINSSPTIIFPSIYFQYHGPTVDKATFLCRSRWKTYLQKDKGKQFLLARVQYLENVEQAKPHDSLTEKEERGEKMSLSLSFSSFLLFVVVRNCPLLSFAFAETIFSLFFSSSFFPSFSDKSEE